MLRLGAHRASRIPAILIVVLALHTAGSESLRAQGGGLTSNDASFGVWPWLVGNIDAQVPAIIAQAQASGIDTIYLHLYRTTGVGLGTLYMADETGNWPASLGSLVPHVQLRSFISQAHAAGLQVVGVVNCFLASDPLPGNVVHEQVLRGVIQYLLKTFMPNGEPAYALDGIALDRVRFETGTSNPASAVTSFVQSVKDLCGLTPLHAYLPANLFHIDGPPYDGSFRTYASAMSLLSGQYGHDWVALSSILDVTLPMAYIADGGLYGSNYGLMQAYLQTVSTFAKQAQFLSGDPDLRVVPCVRAWNDSSGITTASSLNASMDGALLGGAEGFMSFRYFTSSGQTSWWNAIGNHCTPGPDVPLARIAVTNVQGLTATVSSAASSTLHPPLQTRFDWNDDGVADTGWSLSSSAQFLAPFVGSHVVAVEVMDALGRRTAMRRRVTLGSPNLAMAPGVISLSQGGTANVTVNVGPGGAGLIYVLALSGSGTSPGVPTGDGLMVPLNPDDWFYYSIALANTALLPGFQGVLSGTGSANASILFPPGALPGSLAFSTLNVGGAAYDLAQMRYVLVLQSVPLVFLP